MINDAKGCEALTCDDEPIYKHESLDTAIHSIWTIRDRLQGLKSRINSEPSNEPTGKTLSVRSLKEVLTEGRGEINDVVSQCHSLIEDLNSELFD